MAALFNDLPNEIILEILNTLATIDLQSLITSRLISRRFSALVEDTINSIQNVWNTDDEGNPRATRIHPLWIDKFKGLFNTADCFGEGEKRRMAFLTLDGDLTLPFRRLSWANTESKRDAYLRQEASWRDLSVTFGQPPITHLDVVKSFSTPEYDSVDYYQVDLPSSGLTMGLFYDVLLCDKATFGRQTGSWELIVGRRLRSFDTLFEYECFIPDDKELVDSSKEARQAAILYVRGGPVSRKTPSRAAKEKWTVGSRIEQKLLPWQGPIQNIIFTNYFD